MGVERANSRRAIRALVERGMVAAPEGQVSLTSGGVMALALVEILAELYGGDPLESKVPGEPLDLDEFLAGPDDDNHEIVLLPEWGPHEEGGTP